MNDINKMPPKCQYCPYWEVCKFPWVCPDIGDKKPKRTEKRTKTHASDLISRQALCEYALNQKDKNITANDIMRFPPAQPEVAKDTNVLTNDCISRQAVIDAINSLINRFEQILRDIRETKADDSVCGMCEYDGAYIGQSGDWCNECPGFEKDDCFKLSEACRKRWLESVALPPAQPERKRGKWIEDDDGWDEVIWRCSECDAVFTLVDGTPKENEYYFCPHCGADMRGEQDG